MTVMVRDENVETEVKSGIQEIKDQTKQVVGQVQQRAQEVAGQAQAQAKPAVATRKEQAVENLGSVAEAFRVTGDELRNQDKGAVAQYADKIADQIDRISGYLEERDVDQLLEEAENFARRQPELFLGGAFLLGMLLGRFIKSSGQRREWAKRGQFGAPSQPYSADYPVRDYGQFGQSDAPNTFSSSK
jgi:hypothetical protein